MKILFTADIHIKLRQKGVPINWLKDRFQLFIDQLYDMQQQADLLVLGGDIFDSVPTPEEMELYFDLISSCSITTLIYSGNHEAITKNTTFLSSFKQATSKISPECLIIDDFYRDELLGLDIIPYNRLKNKYPFDCGRVLCTHVRGEIPPHVKPEVDLNLFSGWDIVLAGDLHSYSNSQRNILYPGSPYTTSYHRDKVKTGAILLDTDTLDHKWIEFNLPQQLKITVNAGDDTPNHDFHHIVYEVVGNMSELSNVESSAIVSKKVSKKATDTKLILSGNMTIIDEIIEYLRYIVMLSENDIEKVINEFKSSLERVISNEEI